MPRISELFDLNAVLFLYQGLERILQEGAIGQELGRSLALTILDVGGVEGPSGNIDSFPKVLAL